LGAFGGGGARGAAPPRGARGAAPPFDAAVRWTALALQEEDYDQVVRGLYEEVIRRDGRFAFDRINLARSLLKLRDEKSALALLAEARRIDPGYAHAAYFEGVAYRRRSNSSAARSALTTALALSPDLAEAHFQLALVHEREGRRDRAAASLAEMLRQLDRGAGESGGPGRLRADVAAKARSLAHRHLAIQALDSGDEALFDRHDRLAQQHAGASAPTDEDLDLGPGLAPLDPGGREIQRELSRERIARPEAPGVPEPLWETRPAPFVLPAGARSVVRADLATGPPTHLLVAAPDATRVVSVRTGRIATWPGLDALCCADLDGDGRAEIVVADPSGAIRCTPLPDEPAPVAPPPLAATSIPMDRGAALAIARDLDADADLDLVVAGTRKGRPVLVAVRNRTVPRTRPEGAAAPTAPPRGKLDLAPLSHAECSLTTELPGPALGLAAADLDDDNTVDIVVFARGTEPRAFLNARQDRFVPMRVAGPAASGPGVAADLDGDGTLDLAYPAGDTIAVVAAPANAPGRPGEAGPAVGEASGRGRWRSVPDGRSLRSRAGNPAAASLPRTVSLTGATPAGVAAADLDLDGRQDLLVRTRAGPTALLLNRSEPGRFELARHRPDFPSAGGGDVAAIDLDWDGDLDLLATGPLMWVAAGAAVPPSIRVSLLGTEGKASVHGIGSRLWVRAGGRSIRLDVSAPTELVGLAGAPRADLVRVLWTNGTVQNHLGPATDPPGQRTPVASGTHLVIRQKVGLAGSCPYLYYRRAGADRRWMFVTDVLAGSPLGLPSPAGGWVPASPLEIVGLAGDDVPATGPFDLRVTEEYREVTFLDQLSLVVADHALDTVVVPAGGGIGSRHEPHPVALATVLAPRRAHTIDGQDVTDRLRATDGRTTTPPASPVQGLAPDDGLTLEFPASPLATLTGGRIWLVLEGLVYWTDAGINTALAQARPHLLAPPVLQVPDRRGGWRTVLFPLPFPAGRTKVSAVDVTGLVDPRDPRIRIRTTMRFFWDRIALGFEPPPAAGVRTALTVHGIEPRRARVLPVPCSRLSPESGEPPWRVDPGRPLDLLEADWIAPVGGYTRHGPIGDLLSRFDDRYAVLGPGDGVEATFDLPARPPAGRRRTLLVRIAGWCKDAHPATFASTTVGPLPHRGMPPYEPRSPWSAARQSSLRESMASLATRHRGPRPARGQSIGPAPPGR
jgi:hypothetical protein